MRLSALRHRLFLNLHPTAWSKRGLSPLNRLLAALICLAVLTANFESEPVLYRGREGLFFAAEIFFGVVFLIEYCARIWTAAENPAFGPGLGGRLRYVMSLPALIDLLAISTLFLTFFGNETSLLRLFRLLRILSLAKLGRFSSAMRAIGEAIRSRRYELFVSLVCAGMLPISSTLMFMVEGPGQPDAFGSIPRAMWWAVVTLTTVGYGDAAPVTPLGKLLAGLTALTGIGVIAIPTGILASAFSDALQRERLATIRKHGQEPPSPPVR